jgi:hypothetical protein
VSLHILVFSFYACLNLFRLSVFLANIFITICLFGVGRWWKWIHSLSLFLSITKVPFLEREDIDSLPYVVAATLLTLPVSLHEDVLDVLCWHLLPFTMNNAERTSTVDNCVLPGSFVYPFVCLFFSLKFRCLDVKTNLSSWIPHLGELAIKD